MCKLAIDELQRTQHSVGASRLNPHVQFLSFLSVSSFVHLSIVVNVCWYKLHCMLVDPKQHR